MSKRIVWVLSAALFTLLLVLGLAPVALAGSWSDVPDSLLASYGVSETQVKDISSGYPDGTFRPSKSITRAQFVKMADAAFGVTPLASASATFSDVPTTHFYHPEIEAAYAAGLVNGVGGGLFGPERNLSREQAIAIIARRVAQQDGFSLSALTEAQIAGALGAYADGPLVSTPLREEMAHALIKGITKGNAQGNLAPQAQIGRLAAATLLVRATAPIVTPAAPTLSALSPTSGPTAGGTLVTLTGSNFTGASAVSFGATPAATFTVVSSTQITAVSPAQAAGPVNVRVTTTAGTSENTAADDFTYTESSTAPATPTVTSWPTASTITPGAALSESTLSGGSASVPGSFAFAAPSTVPAAAGSYSAPVIFTPTDTAAYTTVTGTVTVEVNASTGSAPVITSLEAETVTPTTGAPYVAGPTAGGNTVTILGSGLTGVTGVSFGGTAATSFTVVSATRITAVAPSAPAGAVDVTVTRSGAVSNGLEYAYVIWAVTGNVKGKTAESETVAMAGATVTLRVSANDPLFNAHYDPAHDDNIIGVAITSEDGEYSISTASFKGAPLPIGTRVETAAQKTGQKSVLQFGIYDRPHALVNFWDYYSTTKWGLNPDGESWGGRALPYDDGSIPGLPNEYLTPNYWEPIE